MGSNAKAKKKEKLREKHARQRAERLKRRPVENRGATLAISKERSSSSDKKKKQPKGKKAKKKK